MFDDANWSDWKPFPDPRERGILVAPFGPGCYDLKQRSSGELLIFGSAGNVAARMTSLLPSHCGGSGHRNNNTKREYVCEHLADIEYRTTACTTREEAYRVERGVPRSKYRFRT
jgi:hypothetical protein